MTPLTSWLIGIVMLIASSCGTAQDTPRLPYGMATPVPVGDDWIDLFSEENARYWENVTDTERNIFSIKDGIFHIPGRKPTRYIAWLKESFADFELHIEFKVGQGANSGVFFRSNPKDPVQQGMEIQVLGDFQTPPSTHGSGALYDVATPMFNMAKPAGEWNSYDIRCIGSHLEVIYNGWKVLGVNLALMTMPIGKFDTPLALLPRQGHIILQDHGDEVWFRNCRIRRQ